MQLLNTWGHINCIAENARHVINIWKASKWHGILLPSFSGRRRHLLNTPVATVRSSGQMDAIYFSSPIEFSCPSPKLGGSCAFMILVHLIQGSRSLSTKEGICRSALQSRVHTSCWENIRLNWMHDHPIKWMADEHVFCTDAHVLLDYMLETENVLALLFRVCSRFSELWCACLPYAWLQSHKILPQTRPRSSTWKKAPLLTDSFSCGRGKLTKSQRG